MQRPIAKDGTNCPLYQKDVSEVCHKCEWFVQIKGQNPQTEEQIDRWGCTMSWLPMLLVNTAKEVHQGAAATESFRNDMVKVGQGLYAVQREALNRVSHTPQLPKNPNGHEWSQP